MRVVAALSIAGALLSGCSLHHQSTPTPAPASATTATASLPGGVERGEQAGSADQPPSPPSQGTESTAPRSTPPPSAPTTTWLTTEPDTRAPSTPTPLVPTIEHDVTGAPADVARGFLRAALDGDATGLMQLSHPSYRRAAVALWISNTGPTGQAILATKVLELAAGHARVAVFVDAGDVVLAALPYTVELAQDPVTGTWSVIDAGLTQP